MTADVVIYTKAGCPFCTKAMGLFDKKGIKYTEIKAGSDENLKQEMISKSNGRKTFPQIFINDEHIGGCDDLMMLEANNELDKKLAA